MLCCRLQAAPPQVVSAENECIRVWSDNGWRRPQNGPIAVHLIRSEVQSRGGRLVNKGRRKWLVRYGVAAVWLNSFGKEILSVSSGPIQSRVESGSLGIRDILADFDIISAYPGTVESLEKRFGRFRFSFLVSERSVRYRLSDRRVRSSSCNSSDTADCLEIDPTEIKLIPFTLTLSMEQLHCAGLNSRATTQEQDVFHHLLPVLSVCLSVAEQVDEFRAFRWPLPIERRARSTCSSERLSIVKDDRNEMMNDCSV